MFLTNSVKLTAIIDDIIKVSTRKYAIMIFLVIFLHIEVNTAVALVSEAVFQYFLYKLLLLYDMTGGMWLDAWRQHIKSSHGIMETVGIILCHLHRFKLFETRLLRYLVLTLVSIMLQMSHIGYVAHITHFVTYVL